MSQHLPTAKYFFFLFDLEFLRQETVEASGIRSVDTLPSVSQASTTRCSIASCVSQLAAAPGALNLEVRM